MVDTRPIATVDDNPARMADLVPVKVHVEVQV
jgi:hypothetical protein